jgi:glycogen debranching enzyme
MDAKVGDWVVTPRTGKPVEINALWYNALEVMSRLAREVGDRPASREYETLAAQAALSLRGRFWNAERGYLHDVIDTPDGGRADQSLRPNQIFAVSLPYSALDAKAARAVVDTCARELWTPVGLRSLAGGDPAYVGRYAGGPRERDGAYHQGTVWSWLLGPFALAHFRVHADARRAQSFLDGIAPHLGEACLGTVSEVFDGDVPHTPEGCVAQAWSVAEILRAWHELEAYAHRRPATWQGRGREMKPAIDVPAAEREPRVSNTLTLPRQRDKGRDRRGVPE